MTYVIESRAGHVGGPARRARSEKSSCRCLVAVVKYKGLSKYLQPPPPTTRVLSREAQQPREIDNNRQQSFQNPKLKILHRGAPRL